MSGSPEEIKDLSKGKRQLQETEQASEVDTAGCWNYQAENLNNYD